MKLSDYAKERKCTYRTAWNHYKSGKINCYKDETGHIRVITEKESNKNKIAIYTRVSSTENKENLEQQSKRLQDYAIANGYQIVHVVKEIASGINDKTE